MLWFLLGIYLGGLICHAGVLFNVRMPLPLVIWFALIWPVALLSCPKEEH